MKVVRALDVFYVTGLWKFSRRWMKHTASLVVPGWRETLQAFVVIQCKDFPRCRSDMSNVWKLSQVEIKFRILGGFK